MKNKALLVALAAISVASQANALVVYDNITAPSAPATGISAGVTNGIWGDAVTLTQGGVLDSLTLTVFNAGTSAAALSTVTVNVQIFDNTTPYVSGDLQTLSPSLGAFNGTVNFGAGLNPGFFSTVTFNGLSAFNINLTQNVLITQFYTNVTGGATNLGVVAFNQTTVGTSTPGSIYAQFGANEGLFNIGTGLNDVGYKVEVVPEPASMIALGAGAALIARRRKKA